MLIARPLVIVRTAPPSAVDSRLCQIPSGALGLGGATSDSQASMGLFGEWRGSLSRMWSKVSRVTGPPAAGTV